MPIDIAAAKTLPFEPLSIEIERGRLRFFAKAIGETNPVFTDVEAARAEGHPDLPAPLTFLFGTELEQPDGLGWMKAIGIDPNTILHAEQTYTYHATAHAGDTVVLTPSIVDVVQKKGGALEFVTKQTSITRNGEPIAEAAMTIVVRHEKENR